MAKNNNLFQNKNSVDCYMRINVVRTYPAFTVLTFKPLHACCSGFFLAPAFTYPKSSWFLLRQMREKPLRATVRPFEVTAVQPHGRIN